MDERCCVWLGPEQHPCRPAWLTGGCAGQAILLLAGIGAVGAPHHGGESVNPSWLYSWARPRAVVVSQRPSAPVTADALASLKRDGIPLFRTWQRGAVRFQWSL
jgi:hypothetical protein